MIVTLGMVVTACRSDAILGLGPNDREKVIDYIRRAIDIAVYKGNLDPTLGILDICSDPCCIVTLPSFVGTVLQVNVGGHPTVFRSFWYEFHVNGFGSHCGPSCGYVDDMMFSPVLQDLKEWSVIAALCEDAIDGDGSLKLIVEGDIMDAYGNPKTALTIPVSGPSRPGVELPLLVNVASTDSATPTFFRNITRVTKPVTRGYVKLIAFPMRQMATSVNLGYYTPNETNPRYRRIKVGAACKWVRVIYRRTELPLVNDTDVLPVASYQAMLDLVKSIRLSDSNNIDASEAYLAKAVRLLNEIQSVESGSTYAPMQIEGGIGAIDYR